MQLNSGFRIMGDTPRNDDTTALLRFTYDKKGNLISRHRNIVVFVDNYYTDTIKTEESWMCNLRMADRCMYAIPVMKVDSQFFMGATKDQITDMSKCLWESNKELVKAEISEFLIKENNKMKEDLEKINNENTDLQSNTENLEKKITELKANIEKKDSDIKELQSKGESECNNKGEYEETISVLREKIRLLELRNQSMKLQGSMSDKVIFLGPNEICSSRFIEERYDAKISINGRTLVLKPTDNGNIECKNNTLSFSGLDLFTEFTGQRELDVSNDADTIIIGF